MAITSITLDNVTKNSIELTEAQVVTADKTYKKYYPKWWSGARVQEAVEHDLFCHNLSSTAPTLTDNRV